MCRCDARSRRVRDQSRTSVEAKMQASDDAAVGAASDASSEPRKLLTSAAGERGRSQKERPLDPETSADEEPGTLGLTCPRLARSRASSVNLFASTSRKWNSSGTRLVCALFVSWWIIHDQQVFGLPDSPELTTVDDLSGRGTKKYGDHCDEDRECSFAGSYCEPKKSKCTCREEFEATNHIDKCGHSVHVNESCFFHEQCEARVSQTECRDGRCICIFEKTPVTQPDGAIVCITEHKEPPSLQYVDPAMIGVLVGMALMFVIICVVLRLFSKARWRDNRTIFNTPNARLMNVSLLRENKLLHAQERRGSRASVRVPSRQPSMASLRAHSPNASQGSRTGSRRGSRGSSGNASAVSAKSNKSPPKDTNNTGEPVFESVTVEIFDPKP